MISLSKHTRNRKANTRNIIRVEIKNLLQFLMHWYTNVYRNLLFKVLKSVSRTFVSIFHKIDPIDLLSTPKAPQKEMKRRKSKHHQRRAHQLKNKSIPLSQTFSITNIEVENHYTGSTTIIQMKLIPHL